MEPKICFLSEANYPNYVRRIKEYNIKRYLDLGIDIPFYISTNLPHLFSEYENHDIIKVFDINNLRKNDFFSLKNEILPEDPEGLYPSRYPWNLRRFIVRKAAEDGYNALFFLECDTKIRESISKENLLVSLKNLFEENSVKTSSTRFVYANRHPNQELFSRHESYIKDLNLDFEDSNYDTLDGTNQLFFGKDCHSLLNFVTNWDTICNYGYTVQNGYKNGYLSNLSFVIPMSGFKLINTDTPFVTNHILEDRYIYGYNENKEPISDSESEKNKNITLENSTLNDLFKKYHCSRFESQKGKLYEKYLKDFKDTNINILELGLGTIDLNPPDGYTHVPANMFWWKEKNHEYEPSNCLRVYKEYFTNAQIYGVDIQSDCILEEERITTFIFDYRFKTYCDRNFTGLEFNLIVDDGDCDPNIRILTLNNLLEYLSDDGLYFIENPLNYDVILDFITYNKLFYVLEPNLIVISRKEIVSKEVFSQNENYENESMIDGIEINYVNTDDTFSINGYELADRGFFINLNRSTDRLFNVTKLVENFNIKGLNRFQALTDEMIQYSCTKSHLHVFKIAKENNFETIFVAEDDFNIEEYCQFQDKQIRFEDVLKDLYSDIHNTSWDVLLFGCNPKSTLIPITNNLAIVDNSTGAWAYLIKKRAYEYLLEHSNYKRDYIAIDDYLPKLNSLGFTTLTTIPMLINHANGFISTLQPRGPVNYTPWILGNYEKFLYSNYPDGNFTGAKIEKDVTVVIAGHFVENFIFYLKYLLHSLPESLHKCRFIVNYDLSGVGDERHNRNELFHFFKNYPLELNVSIYYSSGGLISSFNNFIDKIKTKYFIFLEHDWVFLDKKIIDFQSVLDAMNNQNFINAIWFSKDDNKLRGFDIESDITNTVTPFEVDERVKECKLVTTCRWSNNPVIFRTSKMKFWFESIIKNEHVGIKHQGCYNVEDNMIAYYRNVIKNNKWVDIRDDWGTFLYGDIGEGPYVGHTDASKRYTGERMTQPEINGMKYIQENPL